MPNKRTQPSSLLVALGAVVVAAIILNVLINLPSSGIATSENLLDRFPIESSQHSCNCNSLLKGVKVLVLDVHMEGNLGDEMETTPFLQHLHDCGVMVTAALSNWMKGAENRLHYRTSREMTYIDQITAKNWAALNPDDYTAVIAAPGPWQPCWYSKQFPHSVDIFFGGSFQNQQTCNLQSSRLIVSREPLSHQFALKHAANSTTAQLFMGADLSFSFHTTKSALDYWIEYYTQSGYSGMSLIFSRKNNFGHGVKIVEDKVELNLGRGETKILQLSDVTFASSSDIEDSEHFKQLHEQHSIPAQQLVVCKSVEQLWAIITVSSYVYTDRYHPGVAAHKLSVPFSVLDYPKERVKLTGLSNLVHKRKLTAQDMQALNCQAFDMMDKLLAELYTRK